MKFTSCTFCLAKCYPIYCSYYDDRHKKLIGTVIKTGRRLVCTFSDTRFLIKNISKHTKHRNAKLSDENPMTANDMSNAPQILETTEKGKYLGKDKQVP